MNYRNNRRQVKTGDVLAWKSDCFECKIVRMWTGETYSHIGVAWVTGGRVLIIESVTSGVRIFPLSKELPAYWVSLDILDDDALLEKALSHVGEPYSRWEAIKAGLGLKTSGAAWQCAKFVLACLEAGGMTLKVDAVPGDVVEALQTQGYTVKLLNKE